MENYSCNGKSHVARQGDAGVDRDEKGSAMKDNENGKDSEIRDSWGEGSLFHCLGWKVSTSRCHLLALKFLGKLSIS